MEQLEGKSQTLEVKKVEWASTVYKAEHFEVDCAIQVHKHI